MGLVGHRQCSEHVPKQLENELALGKSYKNEDVNVFTVK